jgi:hypothetical protein
LPWGNGSGGSFIFDPSQITNSPSASSPSKFNYVTISRCPGDFRFNIQNPVDPTDSQACKSVRRLASGTIQPVGTIYYNEIGVSGDGITNNQCGLAPGQTYYLNYINADATDGIQASEHTCPNNITTCGVEFKAQTNN